MLCWPDPPLVDPGFVRVLRPVLWAGRLGRIMATGKRHSAEQIVRKVMAADRLLAEGQTPQRCAES